MQGFNEACFFGFPVLVGYKTVRFLSIFNFNNTSYLIVLITIHNRYMLPCYFFFFFTFLLLYKISYFHYYSKCRVQAHATLHRSPHYRTSHLGIFERLRLSFRSCLGIRWTHLHEPRRRKPLLLVEP